MSKSKFSRQSNILFSIFCAITLIAGVSTVAVANHLFHLETGERQVVLTGKYNIDDRITRKDIIKCASEKYGWVSENDIRIEAFTKINDKYIKNGEGLIRQSGEDYIVDGIGEGYFHIVYSKDETVDANVKFVTSFKDDSVHDALKVKYSSFDDDGLITKDELEEVVIVHLPGVKNVVDFRDLKYSSNLKKVVIPEYNSGLILQSNNISILPDDTHFYVPEAMYDVYRNSSLFSFNPKCVFSGSSASENRATVILHESLDVNENDEIATISTFYTDEDGKLSDNDIEYMESVSNIGWTNRGFYTLDEDGQRKDFDIHETINDDLHLYLNWSINRYTVKFQFNSVQPHEQDYKAIVCEYDTQYDWISDNELLELAPNADDYIFLGWSEYSDSHEVDESYTQETKIFNLTTEDNEEFNYYAIWARKQITVTYHYEDILGNQKEVNQTMEYNNDYMVGGEIDARSNKGEFVGWCLSLQSGKVDYIQNEIVNDYYRTTRENDVLDLYAVYDSETEFNIFYHDDAGNIIHQDSAFPKNDVTIFDGATSTDANGKENCYRHGYHFAGWIDDASNEYLLNDYVNYNYVSNASSTTYIGSDLKLNDGWIGGEEGVHLYPVFAQHKITIVTKYSGYGQNASGNTTSFYYSSNKTYSLDITFSKQGYSFSGYSMAGHSNIKIIANAFKSELLLNIYDALVNDNSLSDNTYPSSGLTANFNGVFTAKNYAVIYKDKENKNTIKADVATFNSNYTVISDNLGTYSYEKGDYKYTCTFAGWSKSSGNTESGKYDYKPGQTFKYDTAGDTYLYPVYSVRSEKTCVSGDTLVQVGPNQYRKSVDVNEGDAIWTYDFETGQMIYTIVVHMEKHFETTEKVAEMIFEDGSSIEITVGHGFFVKEYNGFIDISVDEAIDYVGYHFAKADGDHLTFKRLIEVKFDYRKIDTTSFVTSNQLSALTNGFLSNANSIAKLLNIFDVDLNIMRYDPTKKANDIERYGLFTYQDFEVFGVSEIQFEVFGAKYFKIGIAKEVFDMAYVTNLINRYLV